MPVLVGLLPAPSFSCSNAQWRLGRCKAVRTVGMFKRPRDDSKDQLSCSVATKMGNWWYLKYFWANSHWAVSLGLWIVRSSTIHSESHRLPTFEIAMRIWGKDSYAVLEMVCLLGFCFLFSIDHHQETQSSHSHYELNYLWLNYSLSIIIIVITSNHNNEENHWHLPLTLTILVLVIDSSHGSQQPQVDRRDVTSTTPLILAHLGEIQVDPLDGPSGWHMDQSSHA